MSPRVGPAVRAKHTRMRRGIGTGGTKRAETRCPPPTDRRRMIEASLDGVRRRVAVDHQRQRVSGLSRPTATAA